MSHSWKSVGVDVNPGLTDSKYRLSPLPGQLWQGILGFPGSSDGKKAAQTVRNLPAMQEIQVLSLGWESTAYVRPLSAQGRGSEERE